jgi:hypothetical protein
MGLTRRWFVGIKVECPACNAKLTVADNLQGKKIRCPKCQQLAPVTGGAASPADSSVAPIKTTPNKQPPRSNESVSKGPPPISKRSSQRDDDDEDSKAPSKARKSYRDDDDEDSEDSPRQRKASASSPMPWILAGVGGGVLLLIIIIVVVVMSGAQEPEKQPAAPVLAQNNNPPPAVPLTKAPPPPKQTASNRSVPKNQPPNQQPASTGFGDAPALVPIPPGPTPKEIDPESTKRVKRSTAYLRVKLGNGKDVTGSGFFAAERGLVFTNGHVVGMLNPSSQLPKKIEIISNSGETFEKIHIGKVLGVDRVNDLAAPRAFTCGFHAAINGITKSLRVRLPLR